MQLAEEKRDRDDILSFRRKFDLICNAKLLFQPPSLSLSDQNLENKKFTQILRKVPVGNWHLNEISEAEFNFSGSIKQGTCTMVGNCHKTTGRDTAEESLKFQKMCLENYGFHSFWLNHIKSRSVARCMLRR